MVALLNVYSFSNEITISVASDIGLGFGKLTNQSDLRNNIVFNLPLLVELNFGRASGENTTSNFGGFFGAGYGLNRLPYKDLFSSGYVASHGVVLSAGLRAMASRKYPLELRMSYLLNSQKSEGNVVGIGMHYTMAF